MDNTEDISIDTSSLRIVRQKIVLLGDVAVGKTSIINRFIFDNFTGNEQVNILY